MFYPTAVPNLCQNASMLEKGEQSFHIAFGLRAFQALKHSSPLKRKQKNEKAQRPKIKGVFALFILFISVGNF